ncbi:MAG: histidine phosphatase family protein [Rubrivivax sp.]|nr:histidine phosphatase family protein [Rubrivivax sp.]
MNTPRAHAPSRSLRFLRHGATSANLAGLRCGGDLDLPLTECGREQARAAAQSLIERTVPLGLIITSDLQRTRETARILAEALGGVPIVVCAELGERRLGEWNLRSIAQTQPWLEARCTPPGGESDGEFIDRIARGIRLIKPCLPDRPLLVGSKGVARAMGELVGWPRRLELDNGELAEFELNDLPFLETTWGAP